MQEPPEPGQADTLVFAWGNPSRGDDAIGPVFLERLDALNLPGVELLGDFQLQIEHSLDLLNRKRILFVDAGSTSREPFEFRPLQAVKDNSFTTHALSPQALLAIFESVQNRIAPPAFLLTVHAYAFELGMPLSEKARKNLNQAIVFTTRQLFALAYTDWNVISDRTHSSG